MVGWSITCTINRQTGTSTEPWNLLRFNHERNVSDHIRTSWLTLFAPLHRGGEVQFKRLLNSYDG